MGAREMAQALVGDDLELLFMDGYDDCVVGVVERFGSEPFVVYDRKKVLAKLMADGLSEEEAVEFYDFNQLGGWHGEHTPGFVQVLEGNDESGE